MSRRRCTLLAGIVSLITYAIGNALFIRDLTRR